MGANLRNDWAPLLADEFEQPYYRKLRAFLAEEYRTRTVYPQAADIFNALQITSYADVKAVILGQDPYHGPGQAHGLSFSVRQGVPPPPSLQNMLKELEQDLGVTVPSGKGDLTGWAKQGVLLLNTVLTVRAGEAASHRGAGWEPFTDRIIKLLDARSEPVIFLLWGSHAQTKRKLIDTARHPVLEAPHPSPLSAYRGFFGSRPYSRTNECLHRFGKTPIDWTTI